MEREERKKYWEAQNDFREAQQKGVNRDELKIFQDQMNFQKECTDLVVKAGEALDDTKYSEPILASEAAVPVAEVATTEVENETEEFEPKEKEETLKKSSESKLKFIKYIT